MVRLLAALCLVQTLMQMGDVSLFSAFRIAKIPNEDYWIDEEFVRVPNPVDPSCWIYLWHCTTHMLKGFEMLCITASKKELRCL
jgi:hypothetical protein